MTEITLEFLSKQLDQILEGAKALRTETAATTSALVRLTAKMEQTEADLAALVAEMRLFDERGGDEPCR